MDRRIEHLRTCATPDCNRMFSMSSQYNICCSGCGEHVAPAMRVHTSRCQRQQRHLGRRNAALVAASATTCHLPGFRTCCSRCHDSGGRRHSSRCMEVTRRLQRGDLGGQHAFEPRDTQASSGITTQAIVVDSSSDTAPDADAEADAANAAECLVSGEGTTKTAQGASCSDGDASFCGISGEEGGTGPTVCLGPITLRRWRDTTD